MSDNIIIRRLEKNDYNLGYLDVINQLSKIDKSIITEEKFSLYIDNLCKNQNIFVMFDREKNKVMGTGSIIIESKIIHNLGKVSHIEDIVIDNEYRKFGLGKSLVNFLVDFAQDKNCYKVILTCNDSNLEFYKKIGFEKKDNFMAIYF